MIPTCLEVESEGRRSHAWKSTGLDIVGDVLCSTRRCVWCGLAQHTRFGSRKAWKDKHPEALVRDASISEIRITGPYNLSVERRGKLEKTEGG